MNDGPSLRQSPGLTEQSTPSTAGQMGRRGEQFRALYGELRIADQRRFYSSRAAEYTKAHDQAILVRNVLLVLAALAGVVGQFTEGSDRATWGVVAAGLAALAGVVTGYEALNSFEQLSKLYADAELSLAEAELDWAGRAEPEVAAEVERVERIFRTENGQWGQLVVESPAAAREGP